MVKMIQVMIHLHRVVFPIHLAMTIVIKWGFIPKTRIWNNMIWWSRLMNYVHGYYHLEMMKLSVQNLIFNLFYRNLDHLMINLLKLMTMKGTIKMQLLPVLSEQIVNHQNSIPFLMKANHQQNDYIQIMTKYF
jgi:hypothetical protein